MKNTWLVPSIILGIVAVLAVCACLVVVGLALFGFFMTQSPVSSPEPISSEPTNTPIVIRPTMPAAGPPTNPQKITEVEVPTDTLETLQNTLVPINDLADLARRLEGKENIPPTVEPPASPLSVGAQETFWVNNVDANENFQIDATLRYVGEQVYFWIENGVRYDPAELQALVEAFEEKIIPTNREFFGSEWNPGVDGDPHLYIVYAGGLGYNLAGYFSTADEYHPDAHEYSNAHEMFLLNSDNIGLSEDFTYGVLAHEYQHMIHWFRDRNETSWMNEGFSELAVLLNDYDLGGSEYSYTSNPDLQLNDWPNSPGETGPHYGAAFMFLAYFLDRFGEEATRALVAEAENGLESVDKVLADIEAMDALTQKPVNADDVFLDWVLATYLRDSSVSDGRFTYQKYRGAARNYETETVGVCPQDLQTRQVQQYGADYIRITCLGDYTLHFEGSVMVPMLPADPYSGEFAFWSNKGDESDMILTQTFDFTDHSGPLTLSYRTWYDLEEDYDYLYVEASTDGERWEILTTPSGTGEDPSGNSYGWGYNGVSAGWIQEEIDISAYAGDKVQLRFEYVTDAAVNGEGFLLDDVSIPEIDYFSDFEADDGGWEAAGWVRVHNVLPQFYRLALISIGSETTVTYLTLNPDNSVDIPVRLGGDVDEVVLVVTGTTRFTRTPTGYRYEIQP